VTAIVVVAEVAEVAPAPAAAAVHSRSHPTAAVENIGVHRRHGVSTTVRTLTGTMTGALLPQQTAATWCSRHRIKTITLNSSRRNSPDFKL
jgi:hypothetical protein